MPFGFNCPDLDGQTQIISALQTPAFVRTIAGGSRVYFQGIAPGVAPYASSTITRAAMVAGLVGAGFTFTANDFLDLEGQTITINGDGEIASITALEPPLLPPGMPAAARITFSSGIYCDVQGTVVAIAAAITTSGGGGGGAVVGPLSYVYVEPPAPNGRGDDATGARGDAGHPFATLDAAIAVMLDGDTLSMSPGTFLPPSAPFPALLTSFSVIGPGPSNTVINAAGTLAPALDLSGAARDLVFLRGFRIQQDTGQVAINADGTAAPLYGYFPDALAIGEVTIAGGDVILRYCGRVVLQQSQLVGTGEVKLDGCADVFVTNTIAPQMTWDVTQNNDDPQAPVPGGGTQPLGPMRAIGSQLLGVFAFSGQPNFLADVASTIGPLTMGLLSVSVFVPFASARIACFGQVQSVDANGAGSIPNYLQPALVDLAGCRIGAYLDVRGVPGAFGIVVSLLSATIGSTVTLGEGVRGNAQTASFSGGVIGNVTTTGSGSSLKPPTFALAPVAAAVPTVFAFGFRLPGVDYTIATQIDDITAGVVAATLKTATGFELTPTLAAGNLAPVVTYWGP